MLPVRLCAPSLLGSGCVTHPRWCLSLGILAWHAPGVLQLPEDDPEMWKAMLRVLVPNSFVTDLVTWVGPSI